MTPLGRPRAAGARRGHQRAQGSWASLPQMHDLCVTSGIFTKSLFFQALDQEVCLLYL